MSIPRALEGHALAAPAALSVFRTEPQAKPTPTSALFVVIIKIITLNHFAALYMHSENTLLLIH